MRIAIVCARNICNLAVMSIVDLLYRAPATSTAIVVPDLGIQVTYGSLRDQVEALACHWAAGVTSPTDRIAIVLPNGVPMIVSFLAASMTATVAPLNPAYTEAEFRFYLEDTAAKLLIVPSQGADAARRAAHALGIAVLAVEMDAHGTVRPVGGGRRVPVLLRGSNDVALVLHTSGTTGRPKRVPLTHGNLTISADNIGRGYALSPDDVTMCVMPLFHVHGLVASTLATFATGGTVVMPSKFNALSFLRLARDHRVTWYSASPTVHQLILARVGGTPSARANDTQLRFIRSCSAALPEKAMAGLERALGVPVVEAYGMTEAAHQIASNPLPPGARKPGSVGRSGDVTVGVVDIDGRHLPRGSSGEVVIRGGNVVAGYEDNPTANAASFVYGWFRTGDQGYLDEDGYLHITGRIKELINRGGEKISPIEIDQVLLGHPAVDSAVCFGVPHDMWGEEVEAAVVLRDGAAATPADLLAYCRERLAEFKRPKQIHIAASIPRTATGKVQRRQMAELYTPLVS